MSKHIVPDNKNCKNKKNNILLKLLLNCSIVITRFKHAIRCEKVRFRYQIMR